MAKQETLQAEKREVKGTTASKRLRREGIVPAVIYGSSQREYMIQCESFSDSFEAAVTLDNQIRECAEIANGQCYLHRSCHPLKEVIIAIVRQKELGKKTIVFLSGMIGQCDGTCGS